MIPTSYSVRGLSDGPGGEHLKSWVIEVSNDGTENSWREIDCLAVPVRFLTRL